MYIEDENNSHSIEEDTSEISLVYIITAIIKRN